MNETIRAAWVIGRRDFTAVVLSKAFLMFLLGPLFPLGAGILFGSLGESIADDIGRWCSGNTIRIGHLVLNSNQFIKERNKLQLG